MSLSCPASRRTLLRQCAGLAILLAALPAAPAAFAEPAETLPGFTLAQLIRKLEKIFPVLEPTAGSLSSADGLTSDRLPAANDMAVLEILGQPDAVRGFALSYDPRDKMGSQQARHWAGMIMRNALPGWRKGKAWTRRALIQAEKSPGGPEISETAEGYWITVSSTEDRVIVLVGAEPIDATVATSLGISQKQLLAGLDAAFPKRDAGKGTLFSGPGSVSDRFYSDNVHATLETLGSAEDVVALRYLYELRDDDHPEATRDNRAYALALLRNAFPDWAEGEAWLQAAIAKAETEADRGAEPSVTARRGLEVKLGYFVGATESIELQILPKGSYI